MVMWFPDADANTRQSWRVDPVHSQVDDLCENFDTYLAEFNDYTPFTYEQWSWHNRTINMRKDLGGAARSISSGKYMHTLYSTLEAWGMNSRRAKMQEIGTFAESVREYRRDITALDGMGAAQIYDVKGELWRIIQEMQLSQNKNTQIVTGTKSLHHLLPKLLPPIDGGYTRPFFRYQSTQTEDNEYAFNLMLWYFGQIAQEIDLWWYVRTARWATSESKLIDNAIIGYCNWHPGLLKKYNYNWRDSRYKEDASVKAKAEARKADAHIYGCGFCQAVMRS